MTSFSPNPDGYLRDQHRLKHWPQPGVKLWDIGAAIEGAIDGVRSLAISLSIPIEYRERKTDFYTPRNNHYFENAAKYLQKSQKSSYENPSLISIVFH